MAFWFTEIQQTELPLRPQAIGNLRKYWLCRYLENVQDTLDCQDRFTSKLNGFIISCTKQFQKKGTCWNILALYITKHRVRSTKLSRKAVSFKAVVQQWRESLFTQNKHDLISAAYSSKWKATSLWWTSIYTYYYKILWGDRSNYFHFISCILIPAWNGKLFLQGEYLTLCWRAPLEEEGSPRPVIFFILWCFILT